MSTPRIPMDVIEEFAEVFYRKAKDEGWSTEECERRMRQAERDKYPGNGSIDLEQEGMERAMRRMLPPRFAVIIPSKTMENVRLCMAAVFEHEPSTRCLIVDDGIGNLRLQSPQEQRQVDIVVGDKPFVYARNVNMGIRGALDLPGSLMGPPDIFMDPLNGVILLNDDALLRTPGGFSLLAKAAEENPEYGVIASTCNNVGNTNQWPKGVGLREDPRMVCFVCVYIPRRTIEKVGLLDERFVGYGYDDDDYCERVRRAGLKIGIHDGCYVDHGSLKSTFRGDVYPTEAFAKNRQLYADKWM